jgi:hypothetical protein
MLGRAKPFNEYGGIPLVKERIDEKCFQKK